MSKSKILDSIRKNQPGAIPLPEIDPALFADEGNLREAFTSVLTAIGGNVHAVNSPEAALPILKAAFPDAAKILCRVEGIDLNTVDPDSITSAAELDDLDLAIIPGAFGVAENGAIWVPESALSRRVLPFITAHLAIVMDGSQIVGTMHEAYPRLKDFREGFGVFIAGPSKTADIEQSLVIGAHGPLSLSVFLI
ncbi:MAG: LUD domain-containing protein [Calditrichaeota bacterium]|nr:LUD domain-containing protein [Calditrichota bacterium]